MIAIREEPGDRPDIDTVDAVVEKAMEEDLVIHFVGRVGASPYMRYTPYTNHRGATCHIWSCISLSFRAMPNRTMLTHPTIVEPYRRASGYAEGHNVRNFTTEWVWDEVRKSRYVYLRAPWASPFDGDLFQWMGADDD